MQPFIRASRNIPLSNGKRGALGAQWVIDHHDDLRKGYLRCIDNPDQHQRIPTYYYKLLEQWYPDVYDDCKQSRYDFASRTTDGVTAMGLPGGDITAAIYDRKVFDLANADAIDKCTHGMLQYGRVDDMVVDMLIARAVDYKARDAAQNQKLGLLKRR